MVSAYNPDVDPGARGANLLSEDQMDELIVRAAQWIDPTPHGSEKIGDAFAAVSETAWSRMSPQAREEVTNLLNQLLLRVNDGGE